MIRENRENFSPRKFLAIRYYFLQPPNPQTFVHLHLFMSNPEVHPANCTHTPRSHTTSSRQTHPEHGSFVRVGLHLLFYGFLIILSLCLGQEGAVKDSPAILDENLDKLKLVVAKEQNKLVLTVSVVTGILKEEFRM